MTIHYAQMSEIGPRSKNEDAIEIWFASDGTLFAAIADGLGGMGGGEIASHAALASFRAFIALNGENPTSAVLAARYAHERVKAAQQESSHTKSMATTLTCVMLSPQKLFGIHVGDTRAVIIRGHGVKRLTTDHSEGRRFFEAGKLSSEELKKYPRAHILDNAIGIEGQLRVDQFEFPILAGDRVLLTTDGIHSIILLQELRDLVASSATPETLVSRVKEEIGVRGAQDNFSLIAIYID